MIFNFLFSKRTIWIIKYFWFMNCVFSAERLFQRRVLKQSKSGQNEWQHGAWGENIIVVHCCVNMANKYQAYMSMSNLKPVLCTRVTTAKTTCNHITFTGPLIFSPLTRPICHLKSRALKRNLYKCSTYHEQ